MYFSPGRNPNEIGDFEMVEKDGQLHCFYLSLPSHDAIGHLVSDDGINWKPLPAAIRTGEPDDFDGDQIWTMGVARKGDTWFMLYTALSEWGFMQKTGLAVSKDLVHWKKPVNKPVISADPRWYEAKQHGKYRVDWRDPHMVLHNGVLHGFICARQNKGLLNRRGCAGYFTSKDGYHWTVKAPACTSSDCFDWECPSVFELDGKFYMTAIGGGLRRQVYRVADKIEGPYRRPQDDSILPEDKAINASARPCLWKGKMHLFHWQRGNKDWGSSTYNSYAMLASPKLVKSRPDGSLVVESFDWSKQYAGRPQNLNKSTPAVKSCGTWQWSGESLKTAADCSAGIWLAKKEYTDFILRAEITLDESNPAKEFGLVLRADETGDQGLFASVIPGRFSAELVKYVYNRLYGPESLWRGRSVEQRNHQAPALDGQYSLYVIAYGPSIEFNINGRLALACMTMPRRAGRIGLFIEDGRAAFSNITVQPLRAPACNWDF